MAEQNSLAVIAPNFSREQVDLIKNTVAKGATDAELAMFLHTCQRTGLDPLARQIHFSKRRAREGDQWVEKATIQTGIDGFRLIAERSDKYAGQLGPYWCGEDGEWRDVWMSTTKPPYAAKVAVMRADFKEPLWAVARFDAYAQKNRDGVPNTMWGKMPDVMLAKCAESLALRKAFPQDLSGMYTAEEMMQAESEPVVVHQTVTEQPTKPAPQVDVIGHDGEIVQTEQTDQPVGMPKPVTRKPSEKPADEDKHPNKSTVTAALCQSIYIAGSKLNLSHEQVKEFAREAFKKPNLQSLFDLGKDKTHYMELLNTLNTKVAEAKAAPAEGV